MGAYGLLRIVLGAVPDVARQYGWVLVGLALLSLVYGALAALAQRDIKRLIAYTSVNHMAYVLLGVAVFALSADPNIRSLAFTGATYQVVSHGLLTGAMFFMVGMLQDQAGTRDMERFGGLMRRMPVYSAIMGLLVFGSLGLPGFSGFIAEFQVIGATLSVSVWAAVVTVLGLLVTTALYLKIVMRLLMGELPEHLNALHEPPPVKLAVAASLAAMSLLLGIVPGVVVALIQEAARLPGTGA
jgi:NADH-quinone oxidoreductase subunit M